MSVILQQKCPVGTIKKALLWFSEPNKAEPNKISRID